jgi:hypothetical protein
MPNFQQQEQNLVCFGGTGARPQAQRRAGGAPAAGASGLTGRDRGADRGRDRGADRGRPGEGRNFGVPFRNRAWLCMCAVPGCTLALYLLLCALHIYCSAPCSVVCATLMYFGVVVLCSTYVVS